MPMDKPPVPNRDLIKGDRDYKAENEEWWRRQPNPPPKPPPVPPITVSTLVNINGEGIGCSWQFLLMATIFTIVMFFIVTLPT